MKSKKRKKGLDVKTLVLLGIIVVLAVGLAVALWQLQQRATPGTAPQQQPTQPQQQSQQGQQAGGEASSLAQCSGDKVLVYVYVTKQQRGAAQAAFQLLDIVLRNSGIDTTGAKHCILSADALGEKLRAYPAVLYKGFPGLDKYKVGDVDGFGLLGPHFSLGLAERIGVKPLLTYTATAIIVEGDAPLTDVGVNDKQLESFLVEFAAANITKIERVKVTEINLKLDYVPTIVLLSNYPLDKGLDYLKPAGNGYYVPVEFAQKVLPRYLGARALQTTVPPPKELEGGPTVGGEAQAELYILEDYWCPFCARLYKEAGGELERLVKQGTLRIHFVDLIIHPQVIRLHALADCLYNKTGDGWKYFEMTGRLYQMLSSGKEPQFSDALAVAREVYGSKTVEEALPCVNATAKWIDEYSSVLEKLGFSATPTLYFWNPKLGKGLIVRGYISVDQLDSIVEWVTQP